MSSGPAREYNPGNLVPGTVYRVIALIGAGGMGTVYEVEDTTIGKHYVLKTLHARLGSREDLARRMQNEARTLARLHHPNIVEVITAGVTADDLRLPFYVMERLDGRSLRAVFEKKGRLRLDVTFNLGIDLLDALDHAHERGVVHRDVKPDNIFLHRTGLGVTVTKLLDFGVVSLLDDSHNETGGRFLGTLRYAAPEQLRGEKPTARTDVYAAALVLYEALAGRGPFDDERDSQKVGIAHLNKVPPALSTFIAVPPDVERILMAALSKDPIVRPPDAFAFAASLRNLKRVYSGQGHGGASLSLGPPRPGVEEPVPGSGESTLLLAGVTKAALDVEPTARDLLRGTTMGARPPPGAAVGLSSTSVAGSPAGEGLLAAAAASTRSVGTTTTRVPSAGTEGHSFDSGPEEASADRDPVRSEEPQVRSLSAVASARRPPLVVAAGLVGLVAATVLAVRVVRAPQVARVQTSVAPERGASLAPSPASTTPDTVVASERAAAGQGAGAAVDEATNVARASAGESAPPPSARESTTGSSAENAAPPPASGSSAALSVAKAPSAAAPEASAPSTAPAPSAPSAATIAARPAGESDEWRHSLDREAAPPAPARPKRSPVAGPIARPGPGF